MNQEYNNGQMYNQNMFQNNGINNEKKKSKTGLIIGIAVAVVVIVIALIFVFKKGGIIDSTPSDAANSAIKLVKSPHGDYYLKDDFQAFLAQLHDYKLSNERLNDLDATYEYKSMSIDIFDANDWAASRKFMNIELKAKERNSKIRDFKLSSVAIYEGTIEFKNGTVELNKTTIDEFKSFFGEEVEKKDYLELYKFVKSDYAWDTYNVYCMDGIITNITVSNSSIE